MRKGELSTAAVDRGWPHVARRSGWELRVNLDENRRPGEMMIDAGNGECKALIDAR